ncbi:hypothetical protein [Cellulomonas cellasea]|uniref:Uncharacterized protein n=1 Tax=Cellulomonas cellasea TaxID=43670 RepID=A0A4Y3KY39_9CELL|nr:hypothetical protein [Cellulomonas cellasea]GEA87810.1 hypothetical protein CCE01nite_17590 [Cellulomonas cellasea]
MSARRPVPGAAAGHDHAVPTASPGPTGEPLPSFERSVGRWLHAYPRRWRRTRAVEVTAVLADLAGPTARHLDARTALGLVIAGLVTRWREHPPPRAYLTYRLAGRHPGPAWDGWLRDDVDGRLYPVRLALTEGLVAAVAYPSVERLYLAAGSPGAGTTGPATAAGRTSRPAPAEASEDRA